MFTLNFDSDVNLRQLTYDNNTYDKQTFVLDFNGGGLGSNAVSPLMSSNHTQQADRPLFTFVYFTKKPTHS